MNTNEYRRWVMALLSVAGLVVAACSGGSHEGGSAGAAQQQGPRTSATASTPAEQAALAAYQGMWDDLVKVTNAPDADPAMLDAHASDRALQVLKYGLRQQRDEGVIGKGAPRLDPRVISAVPQGRPTTFTLRDCVDDTHWLQYLKSGVLKNEVPGGHHLADATIELKSGAWKVTYLYLHEVGTC